MKSRTRSSKGNKSSIKYLRVPLEVQSSQPSNIFRKDDLQAHSISHEKQNGKSEPKPSIDGVTTAKFVSAVGGLWCFVGQPAVFQTKGNLKYEDIIQKDHVICFSENHRKQESSARTDSEYLCYKYKPASCSCPTVKSNFEHLKIMKKTLLFASCNTGNSFVWSHIEDGNSNSQAECSGAEKMGCLKVVTDWASKYGSINWKGFYGLADPIKFSGPEGERTAPEYLKNGKENPPIFLSYTASAKSNFRIGCADSSGGETGHPVENGMKFHSSASSPYSPHPITLTKEPDFVVKSLDPRLHSNRNIEVLSSLDGTNEQCHQTTGSSSRIAVTSREWSATKECNFAEDGKCKNFNEIQEYEHTYGHWFRVKDKLRHALSMHRHAIAGALAGTLVSLCLHPVDTVKTVIQSNAMGEKSSYHIFKAIVSDRGVMGLYRGISSNITSSAPISAIYTFTYESVKGALLPLLPKEYYSFAHCVAGGCSSIATSFIYTPSERIKQQMQIGSQYQNCWNALTGCIEKGGLASLYAGWGAVLCRNIPHSVIKFYTYEKLKQFLLSSAKPDANLSTLQTLFCGGLAGSTAALFTTPFDVVKTRLQTQAPGSLGNYDGVIHALQEITRQEGLQGLYRGLTPRLAMYVSQGAIFFASYEFLKALFPLGLTTQTPAPVVEKLAKTHDSESQRTEKLHS